MGNLTTKSKLFILLLVRQKNQKCSVKIHGLPVNLQIQTLRDFSIEEEWKGGASCHMGLPPDFSDALNLWYLIPMIFFSITKME